MTEFGREIGQIWQICQLSLSFKKLRCVQKLQCPVKGLSFCRFRADFWWGFWADFPYFIIPYDSCYSDLFSDCAKLDGETFFLNWLLIAVECIMVLLLVLEIVDTSLRMGTPFTEMEASKGDYHFVSRVPFGWFTMTVYFRPLRIPS